MSSSLRLKPRIVQEVSYPGDLLSVVRTPAPSQFFVGGALGRIALIDLEAETKVVSSWAAHVSYVSSLTLAGDRLVSAGSDHRVIWWDRESLRPLRIVDDHPKWVRALACSPDGHLLATACDDMACRLWEAASGKLVRELRGHAPLTAEFLASKLYCCTFSPDGRLLATADQVGRIIVWEVATGKQLQSLQTRLFFTHDTNGHGYGGIRGLAFAPDGVQLAASGNQAGDTSTIGGSKSLIQVYDWTSGELTCDWNTGGNFFYERAMFHPAGKWLVGIGGAGTEQKIAFFDPATKESLHQEPSPMLAFDGVLGESAEFLLTVGRKDNQGHLIQWALDAVDGGPHGDDPST